MQPRQEAKQVTETLDGRYEPEEAGVEDELRTRSMQFLQPYYQRRPPPAAVPDLKEAG